MSTKIPFSIQNKFNGDTMTWYSFIRQFEDECSMKGIRAVSNFNLADKELSLLQPIRPSTSGDAFEDKLILSEYSGKMRHYENEVKTKNQHYVIATGILRSMLADHVINSIELKARSKAATFNSKTLNRHQVQSRGELQSILYFLREQYSPNVALAIEQAKSKVTAITSQASITEIVNAIRNFNNEVSLLPVLDEEGEIVLSDTGRPTYHKPDEQFLLATILRQLHNPGDPAKMYFYTKTTTTKTASFNELFEQLEQFIQHDQTSKPYQGAQPSSTTSNHANPINQLPITINYSRSNHIKPFVITHGAQCVNCGQRDHRTRDCADNTCHTCRQTFPTVAERLYHAGLVHRNRSHRSSYQSNGQDRPRSRSRDRDNGRYQDSNNRQAYGQNHRSPSPYHRQSNSPGSQSRSFSPKRVNFAEHDGNKHD